MSFKPPERIYLQITGDEEITWCANKINDDDIEYVLAAPAPVVAPECTCRADTRASELHRPGCPVFERWKQRAELEAAAQPEPSKPLYGSPEYEREIVEGEIKE